MDSKSTKMLLAGATLVAAIAGVTFALVQPNTKDSATSDVSQPNNTMPTPSPTTTAPQVTPSATTAPTTSSGSTTVQPKPDAIKEPVRALESCVVQMAVVNDPEPPLNIRSAPTTESNIVGKLNNGTYVSVLKEQDGWFQIPSPVTGWIAKSRTTHHCGEKVERVSFGTGQTSMTIADKFVGTGSHQYLFNAGAGQTMTIVSQDGAFPLVKAPNGEVLVEGPDEQRDRWSGTLPATGDYVIQFDSNFRGYSYSFSVEIR